MSAFSSDISSICHHHWLLISKQNMLELSDLGGEKLYTWQGSRTFPLPPKNVHASNAVVVNQAFNLSGTASNEFTVAVGLRPAGAKLPSLVVLSGLENSYERASNELQQWITLGNGAVQVAILLAWNIVAQSFVECRVRVIVPDSNEASLTRTIMQEGFTTRNQDRELPSVKVTVGQLFGKVISSDLWPGMAYHFSLKLLRQTAAEMFEAEIEEYKNETEFSTAGVVEGDDSVVGDETSEEEDDEEEEREKVFIQARPMPREVAIIPVVDIEKASEDDSEEEEDDEEEEDNGERGFIRERPMPREIAMIPVPNIAKASDNSEQEDDDEEEEDSVEEEEDNVERAFIQERSMPREAAMTQAPNIARVPEDDSGEEEEDDDDDEEEVFIQAPPIPGTPAKILAPSIEKASEEEKEKDDQEEILISAPFIQTIPRATAEVLVPNIEQASEAPSIEIASEKDFEELTAFEDGHNANATITGSAAVPSVLNPRDLKNIAESVEKPDDVECEDEESGEEESDGVLSNDEDEDNVSSSKKLPHRSHASKTPASKIAKADAPKHTVPRAPVKSQPQITAALTPQESEPEAAPKPTIALTQSLPTPPTSPVSTSKSHSSKPSILCSTPSDHGVLGPFSWLGITAHVTPSAPPPPDLLRRIEQFTSEMQPEPSDPDQGWTVIGRRRRADLSSVAGGWRSTSSDVLGPFNWLGITVHVNLSASPPPELLRRLEEFTSGMQPEPSGNDQGWTTVALRKGKDTHTLSGHT
ncbi:hypothetical protein K440DRAFT_638839 [Wilcoxina mikolae CBS 423.85]|nr:hypothetical protein K440DRAFT_638839 [Wilcoxina mikolae CBS 423.85]